MRNSARVEEQNYRLPVLVVGADAVSRAAVHDVGGYEQSVTNLSQLSLASGRVLADDEVRHPAGHDDH